MSEPRLTSTNRLNIYSQRGAELYNIRLKGREVRPMGLVAAGVNAIKLRVVGAEDMPD